VVAEKYFWGRPSSVDYNPLPSGGSNLGPTSAALKKAVQERSDLIRKTHGLSDRDPIPSELLFASGSGLDPEISPEAAYFQAARIAKARGLADKQKLHALIQARTKGPDLGFIGEPRVNVLQLNLALDEMP
jgi:K+-transporting ATPase ATPase C chain